MSPDLKENKGFGLIAAIFVIIFISLFGLLAVKHLQSTTTGSGEAYLWAQALYTANYTARLKILYDDQGGGTWVGPPTDIQIQGTNGSIITDTYDTNPDPTIPATIEARGSVGTIVRKVQVKFILQSP